MRVCVCLFFWFDGKSFKGSFGSNTTSPHQKTQTFLTRQPIHQAATTTTPTPPHADEAAVETETVLLLPLLGWHAPEPAQRLKAIVDGAE